MNRKYFPVVLASVMLFAAAQAANAYTLYPDGKAASAAAEEYTEKLTALNQSLREAALQYTPNTGSITPADEEQGTAETGILPAEAGAAPDMTEIYSELLSAAQEYHLSAAERGAELSSMLIDYDVMLKRLRIALSRYNRRKEQLSELELLARTGGVSQSELSAAKDEVDAVYYDIKAILFDISALKTEIEAITGETLKDSFDFDSVYLITDALAVSPETLSDCLTLSTIYIPEGAEGAEPSQRDISAQMNSSVQAYYQMGTAIRELISATVQQKDAEEKHRLGQLSSEGLLAVIEAREDKLLEAAAAKAELSKALLALDISSGKGLTGSYGTSREEISALKQTTGDRNGIGLWFVTLIGEGTALCPVSWPSGTVRGSENDTSRYTYSVYYNGSLIGSAAGGSPCLLKAIQYSDGVNTASVSFYKNGTLTRQLEINIFTPYGEFLN